MTRLDALPGPVRGVFWAVLQMIAFSVVALAVRRLSATLSTFEIVFFRGLVGLLFMAPWALRAGPAALHTPRAGLVALRNLTVFAAVLAWFGALGAMPVSDAVALQFTLPLFVVLGAGLFLRERVGFRRAMVVVVGFAGTLVILRPGIVEISPAVGYILLSVVAYTVAHLLTKAFAGAVSGGAMAFQMNLLITPLGLICALTLSGWTTPGWAELPWLAIVGVGSALAHIFMARAYRAADASFVEPIDFLRLPVTAAIGWVMFHEASDLWTWAGAAIICGAVTYNARFETAAARRARGDDAA